MLSTSNTEKDDKKFFLETPFKSLKNINVDEILIINEILIKT